MATLDLYRFTLTLLQADLEALARGTVPPEVQNLAISLLIDVRLEPGEAVAAMARRRKREIP